MYPKKGIKMVEFELKLRTLAIILEKQILQKILIESAPLVGSPKLISHNQSIFYQKNHL